MNNDPKQSKTDASAVATSQAKTAEKATTKAEPPRSPPPTRGPWLSALVVLFVFVMATFVTGAMWGETTIRWASDRFGSVLQLASKDDPGEKEDDNTWYTCGMHPWIEPIRDPDELCPICHMELTPIDPDKFTGELAINPLVIQNIGVRIEPVTSGPVVRTIRTVGTVAYDETRVRDIYIKAEGWIEKLYVDSEGATVNAGDPLFDAYSPKLYSAQSEYLSALRMHAASNPDSPSGSLIDTQRLIDDARVQLEYLDVTPEQIAALEQSGEPTKAITMYSPYSGIVISKHANEGMPVNPGMRVYQIADLSEVWVMVTLFEYQLPYLEEGLPVTMSLPYIPGQEFEGEVAYIYPFLDNKSRQVRVRLEFENPELLLKPGMFANIELTNTLARDRTLAPRIAVIDTGERSVAFVSLGEGRFEPRDVRLGVETGTDQVEILDGLEPGEMVVTSGQFLLDSESRLRESLMKMIQGNLAADQKPVVAVEGASELAELPADAETLLSETLTHYFTISDMLAEDTIENIAAPARLIAQRIDALALVQIPDHDAFWAAHDLARIKDEALRFVDIREIADARLVMADLSIALGNVLGATGIPPSYGVEVQELHCPMYLNDQGGSVWIQPAGDVRNPYMGAAMLACFDERSLIPVTGGGVTNPDETKSNGKVPNDPAPDDAASDDPALSEAQPTPAGPAAQETLSAEDQASLDRLYTSYIAMQEELSRDELEGLAAHVEAFTLALTSLENQPPRAIVSLVADLRSATDIDAASLDTFRAGYRGLSDAMIELARIAPPSTSVAPAIYHAYCPMEKADWLQFSDEVTNPYAPYMLRCGTIEDTFQAISLNGGTP